MSDLWKSDFKACDINTPKSILEEQCEFLSKKTNGLVLGKVSEYNRPIFDYKISNIGEVLTEGNNAMKALADTMLGKDINIQNDLGALEEFNFKYEFFITSKHTPNYKYRVFFMEYSLPIIYPVILVIDEDISKELGWENYIEKFYDEDIFISALSKIINSNKVYSRAYITSCKW